MTEVKSQNPAFHRPSWHEWCMSHAFKAAERSSCLKMQTGAVLVKNDKYIVATGYNGVVEDALHCCDHWKQVYEESFSSTYETIDHYVQSQDFRTAHHDWSTEHELHGEQNCIFTAAKSSIPTEGCTMYTVYSPCVNCAKAIKMAGITKVYYRILYVRDQRGLSFLKKCNIDCLHLIKNE